MFRDIRYYEKYIQEKVKGMSFREFIMAVASWYPVSFSKRKGDISVYPETPRSPHIVSPATFGKQVDTFIEYGLKYDSSHSFFENYKKLFHIVPFSSLRQFPIISNSVYTDSSGWGTRNCYLDIGCYDVENILYSFEVKENCKNVFNSVMVWDSSENIYQSNCVIRSSSIFYSRFILESRNIWFSTNLIGCHDCIFCDGLTNASYCIKNKLYRKEEYLQLQEKMFHDQKGYEKYYRGLTTKGQNFTSKNVTGTYTTNSENVQDGYYSYRICEGKNIVLVGSVDGNNFMYNVISSGSPFFNHGYNVINTGGGDHIYCSDFVVGSNLYYCYYLENCSHCFGCIGLKNKSYCILNKQYSKEEWEKTVCEIFASMERDGTLGSFFPSSMNPFYFNDTAANIMIDSFTKKEVEAEGYMWRDEKIKVDIPEGAEVVKSSELGKYQGFGSLPVKGGADEEGGSGGFVVGNQDPPDLSQSQTNLPPFTGGSSWYIDPEIMKKVIVDEKGNYYKIVPMEYDFLMKHGLPLPEIHWLERIKMGFRFQ